MNERARIYPSVESRMATLVCKKDKIVFSIVEFIAVKMVYYF